MEAGWSWHQRLETRLDCIAQFVGVHRIVPRYNMAASGCCPLEPCEQTSGGTNHPVAKLILVVTNVIRNSEFGISDVKVALLLVPQGAFAKESQAVLAAKAKNVPVAECYWDEASSEVWLEMKSDGRLDSKGKQDVLEAQADDVALVLHTSGTTGQPKSVPLTHKNLIASMGKSMPVSRSRWQSP